MNSDPNITNYHPNASNGEPTQRRRFGFDSDRAVVSLVRHSEYSDTFVDSDRASGFGLLEVVISAGILATVIGASVGLMNSSLRRATLASDRATAMNLAQEAVELVRVARDTTYVDGVANTWLAGLPGISSKVGTIESASDPSVDSFALAYVASGLNCCSWQVAKTGGPGTTVNNGIETITLGGKDFLREIYISLPAIDYPTVAGLPAGVSESDGIRKVTVIVRWGPSVTEAVSSIVYLTNWRSS